MLKDEVRSRSHLVSVEPQHRCSCHEKRKHRVFQREKSTDHQPAEDDRQEPASHCRVFSELRKLDFAELEQILNSEGPFRIEDRQESEHREAGPE